MADVTRYVNTGSPAGGDGQHSDLTDDTHQPYQSLSQWEAAEDGLSQAGDDHAVHCNRTGGGGQDTTAVNVAGWSSDTITITQDDFPTDGILDDTKYILHITSASNTSCLIITQANTTVTKLQTQLTGSSTGTFNNIYISDVDGVVIDSCICKGIHSGTGAGRGIYAYNTDNSRIQNCVVYGFISGEDTGFSGILVYGATGDDTAIYNCTVSGCYYGINEGSNATATVINCAVFNNTDDFTGLGATVDYCASDDADGTNHVHLNENAGGEWTAAFTSYGTGDFSVKDSSSLLYNAGDGTTPDDYFTDDIIDTARPQSTAWDIGAFELPVGGGTGYEEAVSAAAALTAGATDTAGWAEPVTAAAAASGTATDVRVLVEGVAAAATVSSAAADTAGWTEPVGAAAAGSAGAEELAGFLEAVAAAGELTASATDLLNNEGFLEPVEATAALTASAADLVSGLELVAAALAAAAAAGDEAAFGDEVDADLIGAAAHAESFTGVVGGVTKTDWANYQRLSAGRVIESTYRPRQRFTYDRRAP